MNVEIIIKLGLSEGSLTLCSSHRKPLKELRNISKQMETRGND